jgi:hypothetical protein
MIDSSVLPPSCRPLGQAPEGRHDGGSRPCVNFHTGVFPQGGTVCQSGLGFGVVLVRRSIGRDRCWDFQFLSWRSMVRSRAPLQSGADDLQDAR